MRRLCCVDVVAHKCIFQPHLLLQPVTFGQCLLSDTCIKAGQELQGWGESARPNACTQPMHPEAGMLPRLSAARVAASLASSNPWLRVSIRSFRAAAVLRSAVMSMSNALHPDATRGKTCGRATDGAGDG